MVSFCSFGAAVTAEQPDANRKGLHAGDGRVEMLPRQNGGGGQDGTLLAAHHAFERGAQGNLSLAHADIAAQQAVHRPGLLHIMFDLRRAGKLVRRSS